MKWSKYPNIIWKQICQKLAIRCRLSSTYDFIAAFNFGYVIHDDDFWILSAISTCVVLDCASLCPVSDSLNAIHGPIFVLYRGIFRYCAIDDVCRGNESCKHDVLSTCQQKISIFHSPSSSVSASSSIVTSSATSWRRWSAIARHLHSSKWNIHKCRLFTT